VRQPDTQMPGPQVPDTQQPDTNQPDTHQLDTEAIAVVDASGAEGAAAPVPGQDGGEPRRRWFRSGNRTLPILAGVAMLSLGAGFALSHFVVNPADAAARTAPPAAGLITVPIESRALTNEVMLRGDVLFDGATEVHVETAELATRAVVTGQIPEVGSTLEAGSVALEIAGRPVIVLPGDLPTFRTLRMGVSGPDVLQLKEALASLGISVGNRESDVFDAATAAAVAALYERVGFPVPPVPEAVAAAHDAAEQAVRSAQAMVTQAQADLTAIRGGSDPVAVAAADSQLASAQRASDLAVQSLNELRHACEHDPQRVCTPAEITLAEHAVADAADNVTVARTARSQLDAAPDTSHARAAVTAAQQTLTDAQAALRDAQAAALPHLPSSEVVFLDTLPRRIDAVSVRRGETVSGAVMQVSGADLRVTATAAAADVALLEVGAEGFIDVGDLRVDATVTEIQPAADGTAGRSTVILTPGELTPEQVTDLRGRNVRVTIPVSATAGDVLTVPLAALTAGPGGESRIEVHETDGGTSLVEVTTGLAAGGHVEIEGVDRTLNVGDLVVIGTGTSPADDGGDDGADDADDA